MVLSLINSNIDRSTFIMNNDLNRRDFLKTVGASAAAMAVTGCVSSASQVGGGSPAGKPNFVFILIDDLGWSDLGCMGSKYYETPNIDELAGQGVIFTSAYTNAPNCAPTRACLLSGQYTPRHGVYTVSSSERGKARLRKLIPIRNKTKLDPKIITVAEALKRAGYVCGHFGKWHLGKGLKYAPASRGFDFEFRRDHKKGHFNSAGEYFTDRATDKAIDFIGRHKDEPFFVYLSHHAVHTPIQAKKEIIEKYKKKRGSGGQNDPVYAAMIDSVDESVGRVMGRLDELGLADNTLVFFFSDNGGVVGITSMEPLRGGKGMLYEGGVRVPLIVRWPGKVKPGSICDVSVMGIDFYPTMLELAGAPKPAEQVLDGESIVPLLTRSGKLRRKAVFWHFPAYLEANYGWKGTWRTTPAGAVRRGNWKLIEYFEDGTLELYNLRADIGEQNDLAQRMPEKARQLHVLLRNWRKSVEAAVPTELNPGYNPNLEGKG
jgi:arylsulfatase A-like enzyme